MDLESGKDVTQGERGELWVRGLNITKGYWSNKEATKGTFSSVRFQNHLYNFLR